MPQADPAPALERQGRLALRLALGAAALAVVAAAALWSRYGAAVFVDAFGYLAGCF
jgi:hypothetical protein